MSENLPILWEDKINSPELKAYLKQFGKNGYMTAEEVNQLRDAVNEMSLIQKSTFLGVAEPADVPTGTGRGYWEVITPGTYTNHGGGVLGIDERGLIARDTAGAFTMSKVPYVFSNYAKAVELDNYSKISYSNNYFILENATYGAYIAGNQGTRFIQNSGSTWYVSEFITIESGEKINIYYFLTLKTASYIIYDENKTKLSDGIASSFTATTNAKFCRITVSVSNYELFQIIKGGVAPTEYVKPGFSIAKKTGRNFLVEIESLNKEVLTIDQYAPDKTTLTESSNIFILENSVYGQYMNGNSGSRVIQNSGSTWYVSEFIPIESGEQIKFYDFLTLKTCIYIFYDINKNKISDGLSNGFTATTNTKFFKTEVKVSNYYTFQIIKGSVAPDSFIIPSYSFDKKNGKKIVFHIDSLSEEVLTKKAFESVKIDADNVSFLSASINLYNPLNPLIIKGAYLNNGGYYISSGSPTTQVVTERVKPNTIYTFYRGVSLEKITSNLNIINQNGSTTIVTAAEHTAIGYYETSSTAEFIRFAMSIDSIYYMLIEGQVQPTLFVQFGYSFRNDILAVTDPNNLPWAGKKIGFLGDSITMQFNYGSKFLETTQGIEGFRQGTNGGNISFFGRNLTSEILAPLDLMVILGGTNNYGVAGGGTVGTINSPMDDSTVHGQIKGAINRILSIKPNIRIVFFTCFNRGLYSPTPDAGDGFTPNAQGLTIKIIAEAIIDECRHLGIANYDLLSNSGINKYNVSLHCGDNLHPNGEGANRLGTLMGLAANKYKPFNF
jgi:hypothetical protein